MFIIYKQCYLFSEIPVIISCVVKRLYLTCEETYVVSIMSESPPALAWRLISGDDLIIAKGCLTEGDILQLKGLFLYFDSDKDGYINKEQLVLALKYLGLNPRDNLVHSFTHSANKNTFHVDFNTFVEILSREQERLLEVKAELDSLFAFVDPQETGEITVKQLQQ